MAYHRSHAPIYDFLGLDIEVTGPGKATARMIVTEQHFSGAGRMHGGLVFVVFDSVMGYAMGSLLDAGTDLATVEISQRFIRMVGLGELRVEAEVVHPGRKIMQLDGRAWESRGKLAATAAGSFIVIGQRQNAPAS